jgi:hypothetical protein
VSSKAAAAILGMSERSVRYHPNLPRVQVARGRYGFRKSDIEKLSRDGWQPLGDAAQRIVDQCGADIRDHSIKMQRELNRRREGGERS